MLSIKTALEEILKTDIQAAELFSRGLLNRAQYAKSIRPFIEDRTKKPVSVQSIAMALSRLKQNPSLLRVPNHVEVEQLTINAPVVDLIYEKSDEVFKKLNKVAGLAVADADFFATSTSSREISFVVSQNLQTQVEKLIGRKPHYASPCLTAATIRFHKNLVRQPNIGLYFHRKMSQKEIVLDKVFSTYNEFTVIFEPHHLESLVKVLKDDSPKF